MRCVDDDARDGGASVRGGVLYAAFGVARVARRGVERSGIGEFGAARALCVAPGIARARGRGRADAIVREG